MPLSSEAIIRAQNRLNSMHTTPTAGNQAEPKQHYLIAYQATPLITNDRLILQAYAIFIKLQRGLEDYQSNWVDSWVWLRIDVVVLTRVHILRETSMDSESPVLTGKVKQLTGNLHFFIFIFIKFFQSYLIEVIFSRNVIWSYSSVHSTMTPVTSNPSKTPVTLWYHMKYNVCQFWKMRRCWFTFNT